MEYIGKCEFKMNFEENYSIKIVNIVKLYPIIANSAAEARHYINNCYKTFCKHIREELMVSEVMMISHSNWECFSTNEIERYPDLYPFEIPDFKLKDFLDIRKI